MSDASDEQHHIQMSKSPSSKLAQIGLHHLHRKAVPQFLQAFEMIININQYLFLKACEITNEMEVAPRYTLFTHCFHCYTIQTALYFYSYTA